jgi:hypothetical protein
MANVKKVVAEDQETEFDRSKSRQKGQELSTQEKADIQRVLSQSSGSVSFTESRRDKQAALNKV